MIGAQSLKNTDTTKIKGYNASKEVLGASNLIIVKILEQTAKKRSYYCDGLVLVQHCIPAVQECPCFEHPVFAWFPGNHS